MKCKNCGTQNSAQALKCSNCNVPLQGSMVVENPGSRQGASGNVTCKNCKATNPADALKCHQCNAPLTGSMVMDPNAKSLGASQVMCKNCKTTNSADALKCVACNAPLDGSMVIKDDKPAAVKIDKSTTAIHQADTNKMPNACPACGYPNQPFASTCVKCDTPLDGKKHTEVKTAPVTAPESKSTLKKSGKSMDLTINPWAEQPAKPATCSLTPLKSDFSADKSPILLSSEKNKLNRENLDPGNQTITSAGQASINFNNGSWMIEDTSVMQTTFIKVNGATELKNGDILLMGNKLFKFTAE